MTDMKKFKEELNEDENLVEGITSFREFLYEKTKNDKYKSDDSDDEEEESEEEESEDDKKK